MGRPSHVGNASRDWVRRPSPHAPPCLRLRPGEQEDGYSASSTSSRPREHHQYGEVFGDEPGAVQGHLAVGGWLCYVGRYSRASTHSSPDTLVGTFFLSRLGQPEAIAGQLANLAFSGSVALATSCVTGSWSTVACRPSSRRVKSTIFSSGNSRAS
jgi:hypothetical protein